MKLTTRLNGNNVEIWADLKHGEYLFFNSTEDKPCGIVFKCPGCNEPLAINNQKNGPSWDINFETLTAMPSILHSRDGKGCGWHGYLTNGELKQ